MSYMNLMNIRIVILELLRVLPYHSGSQKIDTFCVGLKPEKCVNHWCANLWLHFPKILIQKLTFSVTDIRTFQK